MFLIVLLNEMENKGKGKGGEKDEDILHAF